MSKAKPFNISKQLVMKAYRLVKANKGAAGVRGIASQRGEGQFAEILSNLDHLDRRLPTALHL